MEKDMLDLTASVESLVTDTATVRKTVDDLHAQLRSYTRAHWVTAGVGAVVALILGIGVFVVASNAADTAAVTRANTAAIEANNQKLCPMVTSIIPGPGDPRPPAGPAGDRGRLVIGKFEQLARDFHCPGPIPTLTIPPVLHPRSTP